jgi:uncharacterized phage-associated protein
MAQYTASQIAETLIYLARKRGIDISNLKLQKLLYYAQAWNLVFTKRALFSESIEAWVHGPVVPSIFRRFKAFRWNTIDCEVTPVDDEAVIAHLNSVLDVYGEFGASQLERLTHSESPWREARAGLAPDTPSNQVITSESMVVFYTKLANGKA